MRTRLFAAWIMFFGALAWAVALGWLHPDKTPWRMLLDHWPHCIGQIGLMLLSIVVLSRRGQSPPTYFHLKP